MKWWTATGVLAVWLASAPAAAQDAGCEAGVAEAERLYRAREWRAAGMAFVELARRDPPCPSTDAILYNASVALDLARLVGRAIQVRAVLLRHFPTSPVYGRALWDQATGYHALAMYEQAADFYVRFAEELPGELGADCTAEERHTGRCRDARLALENAAFFRLGLGDREGAERAVALFLASYRETSPELAAAMAFSLSPVPRRAEEIADPPAVIAWAEAFLRDFGGSARLHEQTRALVWIARAHLTAGRADDAQAALERVLALVTPERLALLSWDDDDQALQRVLARNALAEALFLLADLQPLSVPAPPPIRGPHTAAGLRAWAEGPLAAWATARRAAVEAIEPAYERVEAEDMPDWTVAAHERLGARYREAIDAARAVPTPAWVERDDALWLTLDEAREAALAPLREAALGHHRFCHGLARTTGRFTARAERCAASLTALDRRSEPPVSELFGETPWLGDLLAPPLPVDEVRVAEPAEPE